MRKRVLSIAILLCMIFSSQILAQAIDLQNSSLQTNFDQINRGAPYTWTITSRGEIRVEPLLCDLEGDGQQELILIDDRDGLILVNAEDGNQIWFYDSNYGINSYASPKVSDLNSDSVLDIVITTQSGFTVLDGTTGSALLVVYGENQMLEGTVIEIDDFTSNSADDILYKFDNNTLALFQGDTGDFLWKTTNQSQYSVAVESTSSSSKNILTIENNPGDSLVLLNGSTGDAIWRGYEGEPFERPPIIADLNNDGRDEAVVGRLTSGGEEIIAIDVSNGTKLWNSVATQSWSFNGMLAEDIDQDGNLEIIVSQGYTHALDGTDGSNIWTFPSSSDQSLVGVADLTGNSGKEIIIRDHSSIHALEAESGTPLWSSPISYANDIEIADFDGDALDEIVTISPNSESYIIDGDDGNIIWFGLMGSNIHSIQIVEFGETPPSVIYTSVYFVSRVEITNLNPNTQMILTIIQYAPITIGIVLLVLLIVLWKRGKLDKSKLLDNHLIGKLWNRIMKIDSTSRKFKIVLWIIVMSFPWVLLFPINDLTVYYLFAPLWYIFSIGISYGNRIQFSIMGVTSFGIQPFEVLFLLGLALPLIVSAIILELSSRELVVFRMPRRFVMLHMILIGGIGLWLWATRTWLVIIPIPIASITLLIADSIVRQSLPEIQKVVAARKTVPEAVHYLEVLRGGEFVGNRLRYKVKIANESDEVVTDVKVAILAYPEESLKLESDPIRTIAKLEPKGFRSPTFEFLPTADCVKGSIIATVSFVDYSGSAHSRTTEPFVIRAVCDLLRAQKVTPDEFVTKLSLLEHNDMAFKIEDWTPEEMHSKAIQSLEASNFYEVETKYDEVGDHIQSKILGYAKGVYTGKSIGIEISISGRPSQKGATCTIRVSGEDEAMILPAIDEIAQKIQAWLCPVCAAKLPENTVSQLKDGKTAVCPFCGVSINR